MSVDLKALETELDLIGEKLLKVYSTPESVSSKVKEAILALAGIKAEDSQLKFTSEEVKNLGEALVHNNRDYDYVTYLRRTALNNVIYYLSQKSLLESDYLNVPQQTYRKLFTIYHGIGNKELLLIEAIDRSLQSFALLDLPKNNIGLKENEIVCRTVASFAVHGGMVFHGFQRELLSLCFRDIDLENNFLSIRNTKQQAKDAMNLESSFFRYFITPVTMVYILLLMLIQKKDRRSLKTPIRPKVLADRKVFGERWEAAGLSSFNDIFKKWTGKIAKQNGLDVEMDIARFRCVCAAYLSTKYPIFLLSVQARMLKSDSLSMHSLSPLLDIESPGSAIKPGSSQHSYVAKRDYEDLLKDDQELVEAIKHIISLRGEVKAIENRSKSKRWVLAYKIRAEITEIKKIEQLIRGNIPIVLENYIVYWQWVLSLIEPNNTEDDPKVLSGGSIKTYTGSIGKYFIPLLTEKRIQDATIEELYDKIEFFISKYQSNANTSNIRKFLKFVRDQHGRVELKELIDKKYANLAISYPKPLLHFSDVTTVLSWLAGRDSDSMFRYAIILGFYAGLRAGEIEGLKLSNLIYDGGYVLCIRKSKTKNGIRNIPLYLIMPEEYLKELVDYWRGEIKKRPAHDFFFVRKGKSISSKQLATRVSKLFAEKLKIVIRFHHLRHSFANWFLIRWFAAIHGREHFSPTAPFLKSIVFSKDYLHRVSCLLFGFREPQNGQNNFSHVFAALARLIGHGSPKVTIRYYIHTVDFLSYLCFRRKYAHFRVKIKSKELSRLLNVTREGLPSKFRGKSFKHVDVHDIIEEQKNRLGLKTNLFSTK